MNKENVTEKFTLYRTEALNILDLRQRILRPGRAKETAQFDGDELATTYHFAAKANVRESEPVCCVSYMLSPLGEIPAYQLRGMATEEDLRGTGIGSAVTMFAEEWICSETQVQMFWCNARKESVGFYKKAGWKIVSAEFEIPDVGPHFKMAKIY